MNIKSTNSLMRYLRIKKGVNIEGSKQKNTLLNIGYYHAYKGCRFFNNKNNPFLFSDFSQVEAVYNFDSKLKALIYPHIMYIETALKNHTLQNIVEVGQSDRFTDLFDSCFNAHKDYAFKTQQRDYLLKQSVKLKAKIFNELANKCDNRIISHFNRKDEQVPIWAIFEILTLGDFCFLYECLNKNLRQRVSKELKINQSLDSDAYMLFQIIKALKNLRNSIAHNNFIYDNRFNPDKIGSRIGKYLQTELGIVNINFSSITDYLILISYLLKILKVTKTEIKRFIREFKEACNTFYQNIKSLSIYHKILPPDTMSKLTKLEKNI
ncbi:MAG: Abi family protein [Clostridia bacterium]|nr:Abi family protein [Clostridia bacterium]